MDAHELYGLPLERFVPERAALAKAQRAQGEREAAAATTKLAKPSVAAWAVNQLVRTQKRATEELFSAGDAVQAAQDAVLAGRGDGRSLREAGERERAAVEQLMRAARGLLSSEGHGLSPVTLERVSDTLHAAAMEPDARAQVTAGCLTKELRHVGVGGLGLGGDHAAPAPAPAAKTREPAAAAKAREAQAQRARELKAAHQAQAAARRAAERAARDLDEARAAHDRAAAALREAEEELDRVAERAQEAAAQLQAAEDELGRLAQD